MENLYIGLMSGTSMDAIDAALVDFSDNSPKPITTHSEPIPNKLKTQLHKICNNYEDQNKNIYAVDHSLGELFAQAAINLLKKAKIQPNNIKAIGSHGQTIKHSPNSTPPFSLQIADPNIITTRTNIVTVADFRKNDIEDGGQGAPFTPVFHKMLFQQENADRAIVNIGGIANITVLKADTAAPLIGFDTGPGNTLLDNWAKKYCQHDFDANGKWANSGKINSQLLDTLLSDDYFKKPAPKSTGREYFNLTWLNKYIAKTIIKPEDVQATLAELTAITIINAVKQQIPNACDILICGGGVHNNHLMQRLQTNSQNYKIHSTANFGFDPDWIEAMAFAWFAKQAVEKKPVDLTTITGAKKPNILGTIHLP